jgi:hypothetical protein
MGLRYPLSIPTGCNELAALGRMANLKTRRQARVKELAELKLQGLVKLKRVVNDDPKRKL